MEQHGRQKTLAAHDHLLRWRDMKKTNSSLLQEIATEYRWHLHPAQTTGVARAVYLGLPSDARLWVSGKSFELFDRGAVLKVLRTE